MTQSYTKAFEYIADFVRSLLPDATMEWGGVEQLAITDRAKRVIVRFGRSELEDFENVLDERNNLPVRYCNGIKNDVNFHMYMALGVEGMIPNVRISSAMLEDEREWATHISLDARFADDLTKHLYRGLTTLAASLSRTLEADVKLPDVERELKVVNDLITYYKKNNNLDSPDVRRESLSYLKAAAVCAIIELEGQRAKAVLPRVKAAINNQIYSIFQTFLAEPFKRIKLPVAIYDLVETQARLPEDSVSSALPTEERRHADQIKLDALLNALSPRLKDRRIGAWKALRSENPDRLSQAANSMVEVLDRVIAEKCKGTTLQAFLTAKYPHQQTDWAERTRSWVSATKTSLHSTKHETNSQSERLTERLLLSAESIMIVILE